MAGITLQCPCGRRMTVGPQHAGRQGRCPSCGRLLQIPAAASMAPAAAPSPTFAGNCAICQTSIAGDEPATRCSACHLPYHEDCWQDYGGCATYGCEKAPKQEKTSRDATKDCPFCAEEIPAKALRCPSCRERFDDARPVDGDEYIAARVNAPRLRRFEHKCLAYLVGSTVPCFGPIIATMGYLWLQNNAKSFADVSTVYRVMVQTGIVLGVSHTVLLFLTAVGLMTA